MRKDIIQSKTEPNKSDIWLSEEGLKKYGKDGWELLGGKRSSSGYDDTEIKAQIKENADNIAANKEYADAKLSELGLKVEDFSAELPKKEVEKDITAYTTIVGMYLGTNGSLVFGSWSSSYSINVYDVKKGETLRIAGTYRAPYSAAACFDTDFKSDKDEVLNDVLDTNTNESKYIDISFTAEYDGYLYVVTDFTTTKKEYKPYLKENLEEIEKEVSKFSEISASFPYDEVEMELPKWNTIAKSYIGINGQICKEDWVSLSIDVYQVESGKSYKVKGTYGGVYSAAACFDTDFKSDKNDVLNKVLDSNTNEYEYIDIVYTAEHDGYLYVTSSFTATKLQYVPSLKKELSELKDSVNNVGINNTIACWGDSLTAGAGATSEDNMWVSILSGKLANRFIVINCGHGGQSSNEIASRQGGLQAVLRVSEPITTPLLGNYTVIAKYDLNNKSWLLNSIESNGMNDVQMLQGGYYSGTNRKGLGYIEILGQKYSYGIYGEGHTTWRGEGIAEYTIEANIESQYIGRELKSTIPLAYESAKDMYNCYTQIIFIGTNGGYNNVNDLCSQIKRMIERCVSNRYIVLSLHIKKGDTDELEESFIKEFGVNYLNLREYYSNYAIDDAIRLGLINEPTIGDIDAMANGTCPPSLLADSIHMNDVGQKLLADLVYTKGGVLGYW